MEEGKDPKEYVSERLAAGDHLSPQEWYFVNFLIENGYVITADGYATLTRCKHGRYDNWEFE